jgi:autotransporter-associated beta strand protein
MKTIPNSFRSPLAALRYPLSHRQKAAAVLILLAAASSLHAQTPIYWNTNTTGLWADAANWNSAADGSGTTGAPANSQTVNSAVFNTSVADGAAIAQLPATRSIHGITFSNTGTTAINTIGTTNSALTLGAGGLTLNAGAGAVTFGTTTNLQRVTFTIGQDQTWTNNSSNALGFNANNTILTNSRILTLDGTAGFGAAGLGIRLQGLGSTIKNGSGGLFVATNTQSGDFTLNSGTVSLQHNTNTFGTGVLKINGGAISSTGGNRSFGNSAYELNGTFGLTGGAGQSLTFTNGNVTLLADSTINVTTITANINTNISGSFGLTKGNSGTLNLAGTNTYTGDTTVNAGVLVLTGGNSIADTGKLAINGASTTVQLDADETVGFLFIDDVEQPEGVYTSADPSGKFTGDFTLTVSPPPPSLGKLVITSVPASATAGTDFSVTVQAQDSGGSPLNVTQNTDVLLTASGEGALSGNTITIPSGQNTVTLNSVQYTKAEAITLTASRTSGDQLDTSVASSPITINAGAASQLIVETAADGSGIPVAAQTLFPTNSITVYSVSRDSLDNFVANETATWSLANITGSIVSADLVDNTNGSATFTAGDIGTANIRASFSGLPDADSGLITVEEFVHRYTGLGNIGGWNVAGNWTSGILPAFNNTTDLFFSAPANTRGSPYLGADYTVRSITYDTTSTANLNISYVLPGNLLPANLTMDTDSATEPAEINVGAAFTGTVTMGFTPTTEAGRGVMILADDLLVTHDGTGNLVMNGDITETGGSRSLTKAGPGTLILSGTNTYTGDTIVNGGVLAVAGSSIDDTTTLVINGGLVDVTGNETVAALFFGATPMADGVYGSTSSTAPAANQDDSRFSGTGTVTVDSGLAPGGYSTWAAANVGGQTADQDFNLDGVANGIAYFMNDTGIISLPGIVGGAVTWTNGGNIPSSAYGTEFVVETSQDLVIWTPVEAVDLTTNSDTTLTYTLPTGQGKWFVRLEVTPN